MARYIGLIIASLWLSASTGFTEVLITAQDYAVDSDVVLESAVKEVKSVPADTINVIGDSIKYVQDETVAATNGIAAVFRKNRHVEAQKAGKQAVEDAWDSSNNIQFRDYQLSAEIGNVLMTGIKDRDGQNIDVSPFFKGIEFPEGTSAYYLPTVKRLFVLQTMENILAIESILSDYQMGSRELFGHQVEIETKFVEVTQKTLNELGFRWNFIGKGSSGDATIFGDLVFPQGQDLLWGGLRTTKSALNSGVNPAAVQIAKAAGALQWELYISALEQADDSDVLSAPRVVTRNDTPAIIQVGIEQMIPKSFNINNQDVSCYVEHSDWDLELLGVQLEVTPGLREGGLIDLEIKPTVKDLIGYDSYEVLPAYKNHQLGAYDFVKHYIGLGDYINPQREEVGGTEISNSELASLREGADGYTHLDSALMASLPYFRIREMEAKVTVADGSTIGMGGLIYDKLETFRDKVPVLGSIPLVGRLFRSEGERSIKRNLMIFVTATQVDVDGRKSSEVALKK